MQNINMTGILHSSLFIRIFVNMHYIFFSEFSAIDCYLEASHFTTDPKMDFHLDQKVLTFKLEYRLREFTPVSLISLQL